MLNVVEGDLIKMAKRGKFDLILHGCNCRNTMGSGIAKQIKDNFPDAYTADTKFSEQYHNYPYLKLGQYSLTHWYDGDHSKFIIINAYTQFDFLPRGVDHFEYASFAVILQKLHHFYGNYDIGLPRIGSGLAGGDPDRIYGMIEEFATMCNNKGGRVTLVDYNGG